MPDHMTLFIVLDIFRQLGAYKGKLHAHSVLQYVVVGYCADHGPLTQAYICRTMKVVLRCNKDVGSISSRTAVSAWTDAQKQ